MSCYNHAMPDYLKAARLLEEKASTLPMTSPRRAHLLAIAKAARQMGAGRQPAEEAEAASGQEKPPRK
jgi:hypothetical protein